MKIKLLTILLFFFATLSLQLNAQERTVTGTMPATGRVSGTPASMRASEAPQTVAIDDEPFDSVMSDRTRIV